MTDYSSLINFIVFVDSMVVCIIAIILILHKDYEDGFIGRLALALIVVASIGRALKIVEGDFHTNTSLVALLLWSGFSIFLVRHFWRFQHWRRKGSHKWREASKAGSCGKK